MINNEGISIVTPACKVVKTVETNAEKRAGLAYFRISTDAQRRSDADAVAAGVSP
jgi:hypothetical protein